MTQTITHSLSVTATSQSQQSSCDQSNVSLFERIVSRLVKMANRIAVGKRPVQIHTSFIKGNLLDASMGPEIMRCLR